MANLSLGTQTFGLTSGLSQGLLNQGTGFGNQPSYYFTGTGPKAYQFSKGNPLGSNVLELPKKEVSSAATRLLSGKTGTAARRNSRQSLGPHLGRVAKLAAASALVVSNARATPDYSSVLPESSREKTVWVQPGVDVPTTQTQKAVSNAKHPFDVLVFEDLGRRDVNGETCEDAAVQAFDIFSKQAGYNADQSTVVVVAMEQSCIAAYAGIELRTELGFDDNKMGGFADRYFIANDPRMNGLDFALSKYVLGIDNEYGQEIRSREQREAFRENLPWYGAGLAAVLVVGGGALVTTNYLKNQRLLREELDEEIARFEERLDNAKKMLLTLDLDQDEKKLISRLKSKTGEKTKSAFQQIANFKGEINSGIAVLEARLQEVKAKATSASRLTPEEVENLVKGLYYQLEFKTDEISDDLWGTAERKVIETSMDSFQDSLGQKFKDALELWALLKDASKVWEKKAEVEFPRERLEEALKALTALELSQQVLSVHPLFDQDGAYSHLNDLRSNDPVQYVETIEAKKNEEQALMAKVDRVVSDVKMLQTTAASIQASVFNAEDFEGMSAEEDPRLAEKEAVELLNALKSNVNQQGQITSEYLEGTFSSNRENTLAAWNTVRDRKRNLNEAKTESYELKTVIESKVEELVQKIANMEVDFVRLQSEHVDQSGLMKKAANEIEEAKQNLDDTRAFLSTLNRHISNEDFIDGKNSGEAAMLEISRAEQDVNQYYEASGKLDAIKKRYHDEFHNLSALRRRLKYDLETKFEHFGREELLHAGDQLRKDLLLDPATEGAVDWQQELRDLDTVIDSWENGVSKAKSEYAAYQLMLKNRDFVRKTRESLVDINRNVEGLAQKWATIESLYPSRHAKLQRAKREMDAIYDRHKDASQKMMEAIRLLGEDRHEEARLLAESVASLVIKINSDFKDFNSNSASLYGAYDTYKSQFKNLDYNRRNFDRDLPYGYSDSTYLRKGDRLRKNLKKPTGRQNWDDLLDDIEDVIEAWADGVNRANYDKSEADRIAAEAAAAVAAAAADAARQARLDAQRAARTSIPSYSTPSTYSRPSRPSTTTRRTTPSFSRPSRPSRPSTPRRGGGSGRKLGGGGRRGGGSGRKW